VSAGGASEALAALKGRDVPVDLLLTDIVMPGMSGPELAGHLRRLQHGCARCGALSIVRLRRSRPVPL